MILYYDPEYIGPIVEKVIRIISAKHVSILKKDIPSIEGTTDADYYVFIHDNPDWCLRISWLTYTNSEDGGFIQFNYECPDMAPLPNMPEMIFGRWLEDTSPAIGIKQGNPYVGNLILILNKKVMVQKIKNTISSLLPGVSKKR